MTDGLFDPHALDTFASAAATLSQEQRDRILRGADGRPPLWMLDIDGVLNADKPGWGAAPRRATAYAQGHGWRMRWAPALMDRIRALHNNGLVEIRWASSWIGHTAQLARMFGLPDFKPAYQPLPYFDSSAHRVAKVAAALSYACERRLIWTDDDAIPPPDPLNTHRLFLEQQGALLIAPRPNRGLQPADLDAIETYARVVLAAGETTSTEKG